MRARRVQTFVARFVSLVVAQQFPLVIGIAEPLHLQPLIVVEARQAGAQSLILELVQMLGDGALLRSGGSKMKPFET